LPRAIHVPGLAADEAVTEVAVGGYGHSMLLTNKNRVYAFGWNEDLQLVRQCFSFRCVFVVSWIDFLSLCFFLFLFSRLFGWLLVLVFSLTIASH
jgi:hypothetical protein